MEKEIDTSMTEYNDPVNLGMTSEEISETYLKQAQFARLFLNRNGKKRKLLEDNNVTETEVSLLNIIDLIPGITSLELAQKTSTSKGAVAQIIKSLDGKGLLKRERDGKKIYLFVTDKAHEIVLQDRQEWLENRRKTAKYLQGITAEDFRTYMKVLDALTESMRSEE